VSENLDALFMEALEARRQADVDRALDLLQRIIRKEPRLAEPHLELGRLHLDAGRLDDALAETREALKWLLLGGQWVDDLSEDVMLSVAHGQLAEILRRIADTDEVIFGEPERLKELLKEATKHFDEAHKLDPENDHARMFSFQLKGEPEA